MSQKKEIFSLKKGSNEAIFLPKSRQHFTPKKWSKIDYFIPPTRVYFIPLKYPKINPKEEHFTPQKGFQKGHF